MNKAFEKILERLDEERELSYADFDRYVEEVSPCLDREYDDLFHRGLERAIKVIKESAEEYKDGWIPCNVRFPRNYTDVLADVRGIGFYSSKDAEMVGYFSENGKWFHSHGMQYIVDGEKTKVMAWQPLPEPYKEKE